MKILQALFFQLLSVFFAHKSNKNLRKQIAAFSVSIHIFAILYSFTRDTGSLSKNV